MASLLTESEKSLYNDVMDDLHDTWAREVTGYKDPVKTVSTPNVGYNSIYGTRGISQPISNSPQSFTFNARILHGKEAEEDYLEDDSMNSQNKIKIPAGMCRLKIKAEDYAEVSEAKRFDFDGKKWILESDFRPHGLIGSVKFYTFFVRMTN